MASMPTVETTDVVSYGVAMLGYSLAFTLVAGVLVVGGSNLMAGARLGLGPWGAAEVHWLQFVAGAAARFAGVATLSAGSLGLLYKVIADGVHRGNHVAR